jgi:quercetin dioxygenase-like cupin family protein
MTNDAPTATPIALGPGEGEALWFLGSLVVLKSSAAATNGQVSVSEQLAPRGMGSPMHVHRREDEWFFVLEGELTFWVDGEVTVAPAGSFVYGPRNVPHTFLVTSDVARFLLVAEPGGFEDFIRAVGQPAERLELPPPATEPPDPEALAKVAATFGIEITGPPGIPG